MTSEMGSPDLIDFNVIEDHKENIQALPSGRSAKALAALYSPPLTSTAHSPITQDQHSGARAEFEEELTSIDEADDPLDVYDRYVKWTLDTYPSAQSTPQSQLLPLLERATKAFLSSAQYKNDPRYLKLWLHYIRFFSDSPRETFVFLSRHGVGESLALYYEEFAAWLETTGRWTQAEEIYKTGLEKEAHPTARLLRKFGEFERRKEARPADATEPVSPVLAAARPALAAKIDPFAAATPETEAQTSRTTSGSKKPKSGKMAIFSDESAPEPSALAAADSRKGWDSIGSLASRKKENAIEAKAWAGETLKGGKTNGGVQKMMIFKSSSRSSVRPAYESSNHASQRVMNPKTGRPEYVFVNLEAIYPNSSDPTVEFSFEELMAKRRGWLQRDWAAEKRETTQGNAGMPQKVLQLEEPVQSLVQTTPSPRAGKRKGFAIFQDEATPAPQPDMPQTREEAVPADTEQVPTDATSQRKLAIFQDDSENKSEETRKDRPVAITIDSSFQVLRISENDENQPPSRNTGTTDSKPPAVQRDADIAKRMRREEKANRTRKIKVMAVEEVQKETQTIRLNLDSPSKPKIRRKKNTEATMTINTREAMDEIYGIFSQPVKPVEEEDEESESDDDSDGDYTSGGESTTTGAISANVSEYGDDTKKEILAASAPSEEEQIPEEAAGETVETEEHHEAEPEGVDDTYVSAWSDYTSGKNALSQNYAVQEDVEQSRPDKMKVFADADQEPEEDVQDELFTPREEVTTPYADDEEPRTRYIPLPPEDYEPVTSQYRNSAFVAQNRLPFMTPIVEHTESSIGTATARTERGYFAAKTPCRQKHDTFEPLSTTDEDGPWSSPFQDILNGVAEDKRKILQPIRTKTTKGIVSIGGSNVPKTKALSKTLAGTALEQNKGPIIKDSQINPVDPEIRQMILSQVCPPLTSFEGYHEHLDETSSRVPEMRKYSKAVGKTTKTSTNSDKTASTIALPPLLTFAGTDSVYTLKRELGAGAFAPVYLVENSNPTILKSAHENNNDVDAATTTAQTSFMGRGNFASHSRAVLEAIKTEDPPSAWEFYMIRASHRRLGVSRAAESVVHAYEMHLFANEGFLVEEFRSQGTLLDVVNLARSDASTGLDETLVLFFAVEMLRTLEALHARGIVHGDLKGDNVLLRLDDSAEEWKSQYARDGSAGWSKKGVMLIDFGRGIDMRVFRPDVQFVADWPTTSADCAEMREMRPWTYQVDYHGLAGLLHSLLFGKYMSTIAERGAGLGQGATKTYRIREGLKRYWQTEIWGEVFALLLNPLAHTAAEEGGRMPLLKGMKAVREKMEMWLEGNCERGVGLKGMIRKVEEQVRARKR